MNLKNNLKTIQEKNKGKTLLLNYYNNEINFGDILNVSLINKLFGLDVKHSDISKAQMQAIGSMLEQSYTKVNFVKFFRRYIKNYFLGKTKTLKIWGTGFISEENLQDYYNYRHLEIYALRGKHSLKKLKTFKQCIGGWSIQNKLVFADPGLLAPLLLDNIPEKKYEVGIIPHYIHLNNQKITELSHKYQNFIIINVTDEPLKIIEQIAQCEYILSTSLHGLIVADSFCIPNQWIHISMLVGGFFKFFDYYSAFDLEALPIDLSVEEVPNLNNIKSNYKISKEMILEKQNLLIESFPYQ